MKNRELFDIAVSWFTISLAFFILLNGKYSSLSSVETFLASLVVVGAGFVLHELAHKYVAIHYGAKAGFRMWPFGLVFALLSAFLGFIFAAPGAVYIYGNIDTKQNGIISLAGPLTNVLLAFLFAFLFLGSGSIVLQAIGSLGITVNLFLALFNMLPLFILDGSKVFKWNPAVWALVFFPIALFLFGGFLF